MRRPAHLASTALALAAAGVLAGCGSTSPSAGGFAAEAPSAGSPFLATSLVTAVGAWAVTVMGGSVASHNNFWQLFVRPAGATRWMLVTPPGVPDNGGLVVADAGGRSPITAFRPSQYLTFTALAVTSDGGRAWSAAGPLDAALADVPDALAAAPGSGTLLALIAGGAAKLAAPGSASWSPLASQGALAATHAGRRCGLRRLTAVAFTPSGVPLLAGACDRPGTTGVFAAGNRTWQAAGPGLPAALGGLDVSVLRLARAGNRTVALLEAGSGPAARLLAAWSADSGGHWVLAPVLRLGGAQLTSTSFGPAAAAAIVLNGNRAETISGPGAVWRALPALPAGTATLAPGPAGGFDALAVHGTRLTVWQLAAGSASWRVTQAIDVPIQFGSSG